MPLHGWSRVEAGVFHDFHHELISAVKHSLSSGVHPTDYYVLPEHVAGHVRPDVLGLQRKKPSAKGRGSAGGTAVAGRPVVRFRDTADAAPRPRQKHVVVKHVCDDRVVAVIEIVSPANKYSPTDVAEFAVKCAEYINAGVHALVIDLLRPGPADPDGIHPPIWSHFRNPTRKRPAFALRPELPLTLASYSAGKPVEAFVEPAGVGRPLPDMPLFRTPELHIPTPLEAAYAAAWAMVPAWWRDAIPTGE